MARYNALILKNLVNPRHTRSRSPLSGSQGQKLKNSAGNRCTSTPSAGGNPNASYKYKSENDRKTGKKQEIARRATASRSIREYLVDSGAAFHIINKSLLTNEELRTVRKLDHSVKLQTANGTITATHQAKVSHGTRSNIVAIILKDSPCLISMGKLCRECGFASKQIGANTPVLQKGRLIVECQTVYDVRFITPFVQQVWGGTLKKIYSMNASRKI